MPGEGHGFGQVFATGVDPPLDDPPLDVDPFATVELPAGFDVSLPEEAAFGSVPSTAAGVSLGVVVVVTLVAVHASAIDPAKTSPAHAKKERWLAIGASS